MLAALHQPLSLSLPWASSSAVLLDPASPDAKLSRSLARLLQQSKSRRKIVRLQKQASKQAKKKKKIGKSGVEFPAVVDRLRRRTRNSGLKGWRSEINPLGSRVFKEAARGVLFPFCLFFFLNEVQREDEGSEEGEGEGGGEEASANRQESLFSLYRVYPLAAS